MYLALKTVSFFFWQIEQLLVVVKNSNDIGNTELETFDSQSLQAKIRLASLISRSSNSPTFWSQYVLQAIKDLTVGRLGNEGTGSRHFIINSLFCLWVHAKCRLKDALRHTYVALCMRSVIRCFHDVCAVHIRWNSVQGCSELLVVKWLGLSVTVRVRVRAGDRKWTFFFYFKKVTDTFVLPSWPSLSLVRRPYGTPQQNYEVDSNMQ